MFFQEQELNSENVLSATSVHQFVYVTLYKQKWLRSFLLHKCIKRFFGYSKYDSTTAVLMELKLPTAYTVLFSYRSLFKDCWMSHNNSVVTLIRKLYMFTPWSWWWRLCLCSTLLVFFVLGYFFFFLWIHMIWYKEMVIDWLIYLIIYLFVYFDWLIFIGAPCRLIDWLIELLLAAGRWRAYLGEWTRWRWTGWCSCWRRRWKRWAISRDAWTRSPTTTRVSSSSSTDSTAASRTDCSKYSTWSADWRSLNNYASLI